MQMSLQTRPFPPDSCLSRIELQVQRAAHRNDQAGDKNDTVLPHEKKKSSVAFSP